MELKSVTYVKPREKTTIQKLKQSWRLYVLLILPLVYLALFKYAPMFGAIIAFKDYQVSKGILGSDWVGFKHFLRFFHWYDFWRVMWNTISLSFYQLVASFPLPIILALSINYVKNQFFKKSVQMISYAPHFISVVVMVGMILLFFAPRTGIISNILVLFGFADINWMGKPEYFQSIYVWSGVWQNVGFSCIIYLAALSSIDPSLHEAAVVDGASKLRRIWHIDLPGIMPIAIILLILNFGNMMELGFEKVLLMQNPLNLRTSEVIDTYVYKVGLVSEAANFSYSSAIGLFRNIINLILLLLINRMARKAGQASLW
ncbi:ABC transporter permease [Ammoniphilus resinae]|uniref:Multiple sugar transport system permease protein/putative aldouronate transport system permease protein n=1 Tax=Ammoniphilus resinae TaxID=861532 RepID=A0ABS4GSR7_9BACL|nr:multiple sugar transport system permease protein/putative aldouronate transport system permease protein [Ammoniphilus resinae]